MTDDIIQKIEDTSPLRTDQPPSLMSDTECRLWVDTLRVQLVNEAAVDIAIHNANVVVDAYRAKGGS